MKGKQTKIKIGIDPGKKTGIAIKIDGEFHAIGSMGIVEAMIEVLKYPVTNTVVSFEDARLRKWFGKSGREKLQGAGSIKRDSSIWEEFLSYHNYDFFTVSPLSKGAKLDAELFKRLTGWEGRTNEHGRDAATLIF